MEIVQNQTGGNQNSGLVEEKARGLGRKVDSASARLQHTWEGATSQVRSRLGSTGEQVKYRLQVAGEKTRQKLIVARNRTSQKAKQTRVRVEGQVQAHPLKSVALAFGTGALIGLLLRRGRH